MADISRRASRLFLAGNGSVDTYAATLYDELRRLAAARIRHEQPGQTLQATALVHEVYLRLSGNGQQRQLWSNRATFFAAASTAMRRILIERARRQQRIKHGRNFRRRRVELSELATPQLTAELLAVNEALEKLTLEDPDAARLVEMRYFAGLSLSEIAEALGISARSADRLWAFAKAWLHREMHGPK